MGADFQAALQEVVGQQLEFANAIWREMDTLREKLVTKLDARKQAQLGSVESFKQKYMEHVQKTISETPMHLAARHKDLNHKLDMVAAKRWRQTLSKLSHERGPWRSPEAQQVN